MKGFLFLLFTLSTLITNAQATSPFNGLAPNCDSSSFSFLVSGHFYGSSASRSGYPASTLLANIDRLNRMEPAFLISLGDLFPSVENTIVEQYDSALFSRLEFPLYNAPGNHDHMGEGYERFGISYGSFKCGTNLFILLDTEAENGSITGEQLQLLEQGVQHQLTGNIFIASHRTIWAEGNETLEGIFTDNTQSLTEGNFRTTVLPLLQSARVPVYWFSGSLGTAPASFFYHREGTVFYIATAIRDLPRDAVLEVKVTGDTVLFQPHSLTASPVEPLEHYTASFWKEKKGKPEPFNYRMLPYLIKQTVTHPAFWWGAGSFLFLFLVFRILKRRRKG